MAKARLLVPVLLGALLACDSESAEEKAAAAREKCERLKTSLCNRLISCGSSMTQAGCTMTVGAALECAAAVDVSSSYDRCLADISSVECIALQDGMSLPTSCKAVILHPGSP